MIIIPFLNGYFIGNIPYFQTNPHQLFWASLTKPSLGSHPVNGPPRTLGARAWECAPLCSCAEAVVKGMELDLPGQNMVYDLWSSHIIPL